MDEPEAPPQVPRWSAEVVRTDRRAVVVVTGDLDMSASPEFADRLLRLTGGLPDPVVDLSRVRLLAASGVRQLHALADTIAGTGKRLRVVTGTGAVLRVLRTMQATDVIETFVTLDAADGALLRPTGLPDASGELERLRLEVAALRAKLATRPVIARALGVLEERYRLGDLDEAFRLLRSASQTHNVKLLVLAKALVELPRPRSRAWLTSALRRPAPPLGFATDRPGTTPASVLGHLLEHALGGTGAAAGYTQLTDETRLRLAAHRGLGEDFTTAFAHLDGEQSTCTAALVRGVPVTSTVIATDTLFCRAGTRDVLLGAGFRTARSIPLQGAGAGFVGVLTVLDANAGPTIAAEAWNRLDAHCRETGRWLDWHRHHQVFTALQNHHTRTIAGQPR